MNEYEEQVDPALRDLADRFGIATDFWDWQGGHVDVAADTIVAALRAFGVDASTHETARRALEDHRLANWVRMLPPCLVTREGRSPSVWVHVPHGSRSRCTSSGAAGDGRLSSDHTDTTGS